MQMFNVYFSGKYSDVAINLKGVQLGMQLPNLKR